MDKLIQTAAFGLLGVTGLFAAEIAADSRPPEPGAPTHLPKYITVEKDESGRPLISPSALGAQAAEKDIPGSFILQTTERMEKGRASNFQDLLRGTPGLFLQSESDTEVTKVSIRGSGILSEDEPLGVQFLLDGLTLNQGDGEVLLEDFDLATIKYAEVFRGADAFRYGGLTLGGAINLVSMTGYDVDRFKVRLEGGSYGYARGQVTGGGVAGPFDYVGSVMSRYRDGYRAHSRESLDRLSFNAGYRLSDHLENRLYLTADRSDRALPGGLTQDEMRANPRQANDDAIEQDFNKSFDLVRLADKVTFATEKQRMEAGFFWFHRNLEERGFFSRRFRQGITGLHSDNYGAMLNSVATDELFGRKNTFTIGVNAALEIEYAKNFENLDGIRGAVTAKGASTSLNTPLHLENLHALTERLSLLTGVQFLYAKRKFADKFLTDDQGDQSHEQKFYGANPKLGLSYATNADSKIFFNFSRSWQPPSFDNMIEFAEGINSSVVYTPLRPQRAWTLELGTRGKRGPWEWELALYQSRVRDELLELNNAEGEDIGAINVNRSRHRGVEIGLEVDLLELAGMTLPDRAGKNRLTLSQSYTLNDFHFSDDPVYGNNRIAGVPPQVYEAELLYESAAGFYAGPNLQYVISHYAVDQANSLFAEAYALLGFKVGYAQKKGLSVFVELKNILNKRYAASVDPIADASTDDDSKVFHPGEGRAVFGGLSWSW